MQTAVLSFFTIASSGSFCPKHMDTCSNRDFIFQLWRNTGQIQEGWMDEGKEGMKGGSIQKEPVLPSWKLDRILLVVFIGCISQWQQILILLCCYDIHLGKHGITTHVYISGIGMPRKILQWCFKGLVFIHLLKKYLWSFTICQAQFQTQSRCKISEHTFKNIYIGKYDCIYLSIYLPI